MSQSESLWKRFRAGDWESIPSWQFNLLTPLVSLLFAVREFFRDRSIVLASSLAYTTAISLVPLLSVVTAVLALFGAFDESNQSLVFYLEPVFPSAASEAAVRLSQFAQTSAASVGGISAIVFMVIAIVLFMDIERTFNTIWHARNDRPIFRKVLTFYFVVTFGPVLASLSIGLTARTQLVVHRFGLETGFILTMMPFLIAFALFTFMNQLLPNTRVHWSAAMVGGLFTAMSFEAVKYGFNVYVAQVILESYNKVYGTLGLIPLCLIWIYICWILVLLGAELAYTIQNLRTIVEVDAAKLRTPSKQKRNIYNPLVGLEIMAPIARNFKSGNGAIKESDLIRQTGYDESFLWEVVQELEDLGAVKAVEVGKDERAVMPSKMLDDIPLVPLAEHFYDFGDPNSTPMRKLQSEIRRVTLEQLGGKTAMTLIADLDTYNRSWSPAEPAEELVSGAVARRTYSDPDAVAPPERKTKTTPPPKEPRTVKKSAVISGQSSTDSASTDLMGRATTDSISIEVSDDLVLEEALLNEERGELPTSNTAVRMAHQIAEVQPGLPGARAQVLTPVITAASAVGAAASEVDQVDIDLGDDWEDFDLGDFEDALEEASSDELRKTAEMPSEDPQENESEM